MIESINLINLIFNKKEAKTIKEAEEKVNFIRKNNEVFSKVENIIKTAEQELNDLYLSQLDEEDLKKIEEGKLIDNSKYPFVRDGEIYLFYEGCFTNNEYKNDEIEKIISKRNQELSELRELKKQIIAHLGLAKTKDETDEILRAYDLLDKKGKLVIK